LRDRENEELRRIVMTSYFHNGCYSQKRCFKKL